VAVSLAAFDGYYAAEAQTWEHLALTRGRVVWSNNPGFAATVETAISAVLRRRRDRGQTAADVADMRALMARERPPSGFWDLKLSPGGLVDVEFAAQFLQLVGAGQGGPLAHNTGAALEQLGAAGALGAQDATALLDAWRLQSALSQVLKIALAEGADPEQEPERLRLMLARAGGAPTFEALTERLATARAGARSAYESLIEGAARPR
jgi:glutamate-ammonia-ligase adenylyltransferase